MIYQKHLFICTNQRAADARMCCGEANGLALVAAFKKAIKDAGLSVEVRAQRAGCMDLCERGPMVVVYPEGVFYGKVQLSDVSAIVEEHLQHNRIVERLRVLSK
ncbi:MAG: (2Fe-2S) ferredoxin domain-containing protein [Sphingobacteriaceae bacterium]